MKKAFFTMLVLGLFGLSCSSCKKSENDNNNDNNQPTVSFTVTGAVSDDVSYSNTTSQTLQGIQGNGFMSLSGMGPSYSLSITVTADEVESGNYNATQGQYINNSDGTKTFGILISGGINISSANEISVGGATAYRVAGSFTASISDAGGGGSVQIQGTFSNVYVGQ